MDECKLSLRPDRTVTENFHYQSRRVAHEAVQAEMGVRKPLAVNKVGSRAVAYLCKMEPMAKFKCAPFSIF